MDVKEAIEKRRAYRSLESVEITEELVRDLAQKRQERYLASQMKWKSLHWS